MCYFLDSLITPLRTSAICIKLELSESVTNFLDNFGEILNLSAPGAAKLLYPCELSVNDSSLSDVTTSSLTLNQLNYK